VGGRSVSEQEERRRKTVERWNSRLNKGDRGETGVQQKKLRQKEYVVEKGCELFTFVKLQTQKLRSPEQRERDFGGRGGGGRENAFAHGCQDEIETSERSQSIQKGDISRVPRIYP